MRCTANPGTAAQAQRACDGSAGTGWSGKLYHSPTRKVTQPMLWLRLDAPQLVSSYALYSDAAQCAREWSVWARGAPGQAAVKVSSVSGHRCGRGRAVFALDNSSAYFTELAFVFANTPARLASPLAFS